MPAGVESLESWFGFLGQRSRNESCRMQVDASGMRQRMVASVFLHFMEEQRKVWTHRAQELPLGHSSELWVRQCEMRVQNRVGT